MEFKLDGFILQNPDEEKANTFTFDIVPGKQILKHVLPEKKAGGPVDLGGMGGLGGLVMSYGDLDKGWSQKVKVTDTFDPEE